MKLAIRFADKIVGMLIILALGIMVFVIFMLGSNQRWFSRDYSFVSYFSSAAGLSPNMAVQYKGFTIGHVKSIQLDKNDQVEVHFTIFDTYRNRVRTGSLVEVSVSPIGALGGNQFLFHPGVGSDVLDEWETIPTVNSTEGKQLVSKGLAVIPASDDGINTIMNRVGTLLANLNTLISDVQEAFEGSSRTSLGRTMGNVETTMGGLQRLPGDVELTLDQIMAQLEPVLKNLRELSDKAADPDETVMSILDAEGEIYSGLVQSLSAISGTLQNLQKTTDFIPTQLPQIAILLADLDAALKIAENVLVALTNNPLLRRGVPEHRETSVGGGYSREMEF